MSKSIIIFTILALIIGGAIFYFKNQNNSQPTPSRSKTGSTSESNEVTYTDSGYSPQTLTVPVGTTVVFKNQSSEGMWTASNPHPVHTDLPEFDPKKAVNSGESYSFTFSERGTFGYHNHLSPSRTGKIVVE